LVPDSVYWAGIFGIFVGTKILIYAVKLSVGFPKVSSVSSRLRRARPKKSFEGSGPSRKTVLNRTRTKVALAQSPPSSTFTKLAKVVIS
jgi:hypothetical protein